MKKLKSRNAAYTLVNTLAKKIGERELLRELLGSMTLEELNNNLGIACWVYDIGYNEDGEIME